MLLLRWIFTSLSAIVSTAGLAGEAFYSNEEVTAKVLNQTVTLEVARTVEELRHGLMYRKSLADHHGMLFVLQTPRPIALWMKNTLIDLDAAFLDEDGCIFQVVGMERETLALHRSIGPAAYAVEMRRGWFEKNHVTKGDCFKPLPKPQPERVSLLNR